MIQTASHASSAPALRLTLTVKKRSRQTLAFKAVKTLAPAFAVLHTIMDDEAVTRHWAPGIEFMIGWDLAPGVHHHVDRQHHSDDCRRRHRGARAACLLAAKRQ